MRTSTLCLFVGIALCGLMGTASAQWPMYLPGGQLPPVPVLTGRQLGAQAAAQPTAGACMSFLTEVVMGEPRIMPIACVATTPASCNGAQASRSGMIHVWNAAPCAAVQGAGLDYATCLARQALGENIACTPKSNKRALLEHSAPNPEGLLWLNMQQAQSGLMCCPKDWPKNAGVGPACKPCDDGDRKLEQVGGDRDAHGCIPSAGYTWCASKNKCLRPFEEVCDAPHVAPVEAKTETCGCICPNDVCLAVYACTPSERSAELAGRCPSAAASTLKKKTTETESKPYLCGCNCPGPNGMNCFAHFQCTKAEYVKEMASCPRKQ